MGVVVLLLAAAGCGGGSQALPQHATLPPCPAIPTTDANGKIVLCPAPLPPSQKTRSLCLAGVDAGTDALDKTVAYSKHETDRTTAEKDLEHDRQTLLATARKADGVLRQALIVSADDVARYERFVRTGQLFSPKDARGGSYVANLCAKQ